MIKTAFEQYGEFRKNLDAGRYPAAGFVADEFTMILYRMVNEIDAAVDWYWDSTVNECADLPGVWSMSLDRAADSIRKLSTVLDLASDVIGDIRRETLQRLPEEHGGYLPADPH